MYKKIFFVILISTLLIFSAFSPVNKYIRKAGKSIDRGNISQGKQYYLKALAKDAENYKANLGLGLLYSECIEDYSSALPYLEKALLKTPHDTLADLTFALAKCYQYHAQFTKALAFYNKLSNVISFEDDAKDFKQELAKRKIDCEYALKNYNTSKINANVDLYIVNLGKTINTDAPEYVPVLNLQNELIFTSKRKDDKKEIINTLNAKYFESMYISKYANGKYENVRRYTVPDLYLKSKYKKGNESIISLSGDGKKLYVYRNTKIYETTIDELDKHQPKRLTPTINFDFYQNHAFLTKDGNTLYFTSESDKGLGGNDIYKTTKIKEGEWSVPENLGASINTSYDEDAPFLSNDEKTLYFSSKGYEGFGNYDIFKSTLVDGKWTSPQNLGQPINSTGDDVFLIQSKNQSTGYYSSSRMGGFGDMDIYKVNYLNTIDKACPPTSNTAVSIITNANSVEIKLPQNYTAIAYEWQVNAENIENNKPSLNYFEGKAISVYTITTKVIAYCDTCLEPIVACNSITNTFGTKKTDTLAVATNTTNATNTLVDLQKYNGELSTQQLVALGFDITPILFDFNKNNINSTAQTILKTNTTILNKNPSLSIQIIGYTDARGTEPYNFKLSASRAQSVKHYLLKNNVDKQQIKKLVAKGDSDLVNNCSKQKPCTNEQQQQNRRVIFKVFNTTK